MTLVQGSLGRFWLWAAIGALAMFGTFSFAGAIAWPFIAAGVGLLASRAVTPRRTVLALGVGIAALALMAALGTPWTLVVAILPALAIPLVHDRREAGILGASLIVVALVVWVIEQSDVVGAVALAPALLVLAALAAGRPQREAAGVISGAGLALFAFGAPVPGISLTLAGAVLMLALGMRRKRLAAALSA
jgi:hypothetical protein